MARKICDFNHISPELNREEIDELIGYYKTTHQKCFLYEKAHKHYKLIKYAARLTSGAIAGGGIVSVIARFSFSVETNTEKLNVARIALKRL